MRHGFILGYFLVENVVFVQTTKQQSVAHHWSVFIFISTPGSSDDTPLSDLEDSISTLTFDEKQMYSSSLHQLSVHSSVLNGTGWPKKKAQIKLSIICCKSY